MSDNELYEHRIMLATGRYDPQWGQETWRVMLQLDDSRLKGHSVLWAQFDEDPVQQFRLDLKKNRELLRESLAQIKDNDEQSEKRSMLVAALWNRLFRQVTGEQVQQLAPSQEIAHVLTSNEPRDVVWIATKATKSNGTHICWSSSVETKRGSMIKLSLTAENALDLEQIFLEVLGDK